jgi:hypothetical protein
MAILTSDEIFFTAFEPKVQNRFIMYVDGIPAYIIKGVNGLGFEQGEIVLNHINVYRKVKGKLRWNDVTLSLYDPITPSGAQAVMEWVRLHHESVTGRDGYSDFYKKDIVLDIVGPVGDIVSEWVLKGAFVKTADFGELNYDNDAAAQNITLTLGMDYCVLNF